MSKFLFTILGLGAFVLPSRADTHIYAGALGTNQNDKLYFSNGGLFVERDNVNITVEGF